MEQLQTQTQTQNQTFPPNLLILPDDVFPPQESKNLQKYIEEEFKDIHCVLSYIGVNVWKNLWWIWSHNLNMYKKLCKRFRGYYKKPRGIMYYCPEKHLATHLYQLYVLYTLLKQNPYLTEEEYLETLDKYPFRYSSSWYQENWIKYIKNRLGGNWSMYIGNQYIPATKVPSEVPHIPPEAYVMYTLLSRLIHLFVNKGYSLYYKDFEVFRQGYRYYNPFSNKNEVIPTLIEMHHKFEHLLGRVWFEKYQEFLKTTKVFDEIISPSNSSTPNEGQN